LRAAVRKATARIYSGVAWNSSRNTPAAVDARAGLKEEAVKVFVDMVFPVLVGIDFHQL
jgi:hypothetical protein